MKSENSEANKSKLKAIAGFQKNIGKNPRTT